MRQPLSDNQLLQQFSVAKGLKTRVDVDGTLIIPGRLGHIYQYDHHTLAVVVIPSTPRKNYWGHHSEEATQSRLHNRSGRRLRRCGSL